MPPKPTWSNLPVIRSCVIGILIVLGLAIWLTLLQLTHFNALSVSLGLFGGLLVTGTTR